MKMTICNRTLLLVGASLIAGVGVAHPAWAQGNVQSAAQQEPAADRASTATGAAQSGDGLSIVVDPGQGRTSDSPYQIKVRTDATHIDPVLAAGLADSERTVVRGQAATFVSYANYPSFIVKRELRVFRASEATDSAPYAVVEADKDGVARWTPGADAEKDLIFVYRVYDREGHFDETRAHELTVLDRPLENMTVPKRPLFGTRDEAAVRNIVLAHATTITVTGAVKSDDEVVRVSGQMVPVDHDGRFVSQQIVARDTRQIWMTVGKGGTTTFAAMRDVAPKASDWFVVGQGDLTFVSNRGAGPAIEVSGNPLAHGDNLAGRAAFYAKGHIKDDWRVTASLDTGEALLRDIFSNLDRKDPRQLLRRMDTSQYYTTYGDDSVLVEDAPTQGRFYLKAQKDKTSLVVGDFSVDIRQAELAQLDRGTFGGIVDHKSLNTTSFGESKLQFTAFASDPGSVPGRDEFRGTGGSLYYLKRRDLAVGSERLSIEVRDYNTGLVLSHRDLKPQEDYDIDYIQGRITLLRPLASSVADNSLVRDGTVGGNLPVLVVNYEYTPAVGDLTGYTLGGRAATWLGDTMRLGVTAQRETTGTADQTLLATDATLRLQAGTYFKGELAQTEGQGFGQSNSVDGGLTFADQPATGVVGQKARAWRTELAVNFAELQGMTGDRGKLTGFYEHRDAGFGANGQLSPQAAVRWGAALSAPLGETTTITAKVDRLQTETIGRRTVASTDLTQRFGRNVKLSLGMRYDEQAIGLLNNSTEVGRRTDAAAQVTYAPAGQNWSLHAFGQATLDRDATRRDNSRGGIGGQFELSDRVSLAGEVSEGSGGLGANVELSHRYGDGSETYLGYALVTDRTDQGLEPSIDFFRTNRGTLTFGARHRFSSALSIHGENKIGTGGDAPSVMHSFGLNWDPTTHWSFSGSLENGHIDSVATGLFRRTAFTLGAGYTSETLQFGSNVEGRFERGNSRDQNVWLVRNHASIKLNPDWRALGQLNFAIANNDTADVRAADFVEGTVGFAYRPVLNDRLNVLARYTYLRDMGPVGQITQGGTTASPKQRSQIAAIDVNYDLTDSLTLGAKYAIRQGSVSLDRNSATFVSSNTQLAVLRADWRVVRNWDALVEGHYLTNDLAGDNRWGGLAAIYRHLGNNVKVGVGYSISEFSTDLANQSYNSKGVFINFLGKF